MRILLIQPPYDLQPDDERQAMPPLGLAYIAAVLERAGYGVRILDCVAEGFQHLTPLADGRRRHGLPAEALTRVIQESDPAIVGVSCLFSSQSPAAHDVCALVKRVAPTAITIMGGAHPSALPRETLVDQNVDVVALGEGERSMLRLVQALERGTFPPPQTNGLAFRDGDEIRVDPLTERIVEIDSLPPPARHLLPMRQYFDHRAPRDGVSHSRQRIGKRP